ncbi:hypothetical protein DFH11DRAFT_1549343 [Phellopilus nigrolimitatus]|nr:hypothetical protein DFH11DRAFT_1549343 [Phellopilus nigrolimitatus]
MDAKRERGIGSAASTKGYSVINRVSRTRVGYAAEACSKKGCPRALMLRHATAGGKATVDIAYAYVGVAVGEGQVRQGFAPDGILCVALYMWWDIAEIGNGRGRSEREKKRRRATFFYREGFEVRTKSLVGSVKQKRADWQERGAQN